jgi:transketolase
MWTVPRWRRRASWLVEPACSADQKRATEMVLLASGSELQLEIDARDELESRGRAVRVGSMPCMKLFEKQGGVP